MFNFFYKYSHHFYLPSDLHTNILEINSEITSKVVSDFLLEKGISISNKDISVQVVNDFLCLINIKFKKEEDKLNLVNFLEEYKELFPPWKVFPSIFQGSPRWNQGVEEDYSLYNWLPFWKNLNKIQKENYNKKYSCPIEWNEWLNENTL